MPASAVASQRVKSWSIVDFVLIWLGGFVGAGIFLVAGQALSNEWSIVVGLAGQYVGNIAVFVYLSSRKEDSDIGFNIQGSDFSFIALGIFLQLMAAIAFRPVFEFFFPEGGTPQRAADALADVDASTLLKVTLFGSAVVLGPAIEELMFRGVLLRAIANRGRTFMIVTTAAVWTAVHIDGLDMERPLASAVVVLPPIFLFGLILAWLTLRSERLGPAILLHSGWNLLAALVLLIPNELLESVG